MEGTSSPSAGYSIRVGDGYSERRTSGFHDVNRAMLYVSRDEIEIGIERCEEGILQLPHCRYSWGKIGQGEKATSKENPRLRVGCERKHPMQETRYQSKIVDTLIRLQAGGTLNKP